MSEPYSLAIYAPIDRALFRSALKAALLPVNAFSDWGGFGQDVSARDVAYAQTATPSTALRYLQDIRETAVKQYGWHFEQDVSTGYLTCHCLLWTDRWPEILSGLNVLRQLFTSSGDGRSGYIIAHGYVFADNGSCGGIIVEGGASHVLPPSHDRITTAIAHAQPTAEKLINQANEIFGQSNRPNSTEGILVDQLDTLIGN